MKMYIRSLLHVLLVALLLITTLQGCRGANSVSTANRIAAEHRNDQPLATAATTEPAVPITIKQVEYATVNGKTVTGYLARPEAMGQFPGLLTIHEWWGLNNNIQAMTRRLAGEGYTVLAVDLYSGKTAESPGNARQLVQTVMQNQKAAQSNLQQAYEYLANERQAPAIGVIGWCFGGGWALQTALLLPKLDAAVIYYGELVTDSQALKKLETPVLGIFGAKDQGIPVESVRSFETALKSLGKTAEIYIYENAGHAFANSSGDRYVPEAAADAWQKTTGFLNQHLK